MQIDILLQKLAKPAQRAIRSLGITTIEQLSKYSEIKVIELPLHSLGKNAMNIIKQTLNDNELFFRKG